MPGAGDACHPSAPVADISSLASDSLPDVRSQRLVRSLNDIADALRAHRTVPCVAEYLDTHHAAHLPPTA
ncbi:hypothetical protein CFP65_7233 [Kitasatospora sp. MMS16-BH015]|uniref:hypothetical protein n=1 Tax=Kitasatospora sp. MMS16-BH015 TaxID=2018025 RepID=UPI000CA1D665|nr:hypothetical protein [Kitasatospora sp. MMS16-BH015]AUG81826.1 hypothetical protein CFP65_7233 [Kitasatospora sp. MMS16-BH015]